MNQTAIDTRQLDYTLKFYNRIACKPAEGLQDIPPDIAATLLAIPYESLIIPFVIEMVKNGWGRGSLSRRFGVTEHTIRSIRDNYTGK
jgi:hypothetical protein